MSGLFEPINIRGIELKNRIVVSPMCQYSSQDGFANDWHLVHLGTRATGGAGLVICEATAVNADGRITHGDLGIWKDEHIDFLKRIVNFISSQNAVAGIQLAHAGRKASHHVPWAGNAALKEDESAWATYAPSPIPYKAGEPVPKEMTSGDINQFIQDFKDAAERAVTAGFKVFEIHAAHGYLINQFLSPLSNSRSDEYGGAFENRIRLLVTIANTVRTVIGEGLPLFVRISATDWVDGGWTIEDSVRLAEILKINGVDLIDCSSGGISPLQKIPVEPLYQVGLSEQVRSKASILTGAVGLITSARDAEDILKKGQADLIFMARQFLRDPYFPLHAAKELGDEITWPVQYDRAKKKLIYLIDINVKGLRR